MGPARASVLALLLVVSGCEAVGGIDQKVYTSPGVAGGSGGAAGGGASGAGGEGGAGGPAAGVRPPTRPPGEAAPADGRMLTFAVRRFRFGKNAPAGAQDAEAWRTVGFDIDGLDTTEEQLTATPQPPGHCLRAQEKTPISTFEDGEGGRDNVFGSKIYPLLSSLASSAQGLENKLSADITAATAPTVLFVMDDVNDGPDDPYVNVFSYLSSARAGQKARAWDGRDQFLVSSTSVFKNSLNSPRFAYVGGYLRGHTYVSNAIHAAGQSPAFYLPIAADLEPLSFEVTSSTLVIELDPKHERAVRATLSAVMTPLKLDEPLRLLIDRYLCGNEILQKLAYQQLDILPRSADLFLGGPSFQDPTGSNPCDALSMAIELELEPVAPLTSVDKEPPELQPPCSK